MNVPVLIAVGIMALLFIIFLIIRNQKDKKEVVDQIKQDYPKSKNEEGDADVDNKSQMHWLTWYRQFFQPVSSVRFNIMVTSFSFSGSNS